MNAHTHLLAHMPENTLKHGFNERDRRRGGKREKATASERPKGYSQHLNIKQKPATET